MSQHPADATQEGVPALCIRSLNRHANWLPRSIIYRK
jgi:hypothetical protein